MKFDCCIFDEYDDNNIHHTKFGPDYGNSDGKLKWSEDSDPPILKCYFPSKIVYKKCNILSIKY